MPVYHYRCDDCEHDEEEYLSVQDHDRGLWCKWCGESMHTVPYATPTVGPMPSKPLKIGGADVSLHSKEELRAYQKANPNEHIMSKHDNRLKEHKWRARERAEKQAVKQGWRDLDHRKSTQISARKAGKPPPPRPE